MSSCSTTSGPSPGRCPAVVASSARADFMARDRATGLKVFTEHRDGSPGAGVDRVSPEGQGGAGCRWRRLCLDGAQDVSQWTAKQRTVSPARACALCARRAPMWAASRPRIAGARLLGRGLDRASDGEPPALGQRSAGSKGPIMKVAQLLATIPDLLPPEYADRTRRSCRARRRRWAGPSSSAAWWRSSGSSWQAKFGELRAQAGRRRFARPGAPRHARMTARRSPCKLQYPDMQSAVEADLKQLDWLFALHRRMDAGDRHQRDRQGDRRAASARSSTISREAKHAALYGDDAGRRRARARAAGVAGAVDADGC